MKPRKGLRHPLLTHQTGETVVLVERDSAREGGGLVPGALSLVQSNRWYGASDDGDRAWCVGKFCTDETESTARLWHAGVHNTRSRRGFIFGGTLLLIPVDIWTNKVDCM